jgi:hypothetical protein
MWLGLRYGSSWVRVIFGDIAQEEGGTSSGPSATCLGSAMRLPTIKLGPSWPGRSASYVKPIHSLSTEPAAQPEGQWVTLDALNASLEPLSLSTVPVLQDPTRGQTRALVAAAAGCSFFARGASVPPHGTTAQQCVSVSRECMELSWDVRPRPSEVHVTIYPLPAIGSGDATALRVAPECCSSPVRLRIPHRSRTAG